MTTDTAHPGRQKTASQVVLDDLPPHDAGLERALLSCCLLDPTTIAPALALGIGEKAFYREAHRRIFRAIDAQHRAGRPTDLVSVTDRLREGGDLDEVGGASFVTSLVDEIPTAGLWQHYARRLLDLQERRRIIEDGTELVRVAQNAEHYPIEDVEARLAVLGERILSRNGAGSTTLEILDVERLYSLDDTQGEYDVAPLIRRAGVNLVVGDSDTYKTWLAMALSRDLAAGHAFLDGFAVASSRRVLFIELEMHARAVKKRFQMLGIDPGLSIEVVCTALFSFDDPANRRWLLGQDAEVVFIDSLIRTHARDENVAGSTAALYREAFRPLLDQGKTLVLVHHTKKPAPGGSNEPAHLIRGTTDLRALADSVLFLKRLDRRSVLVRHDKNRFGPAAETFVLGFEADESMARFVHEGAATVALDKVTAAKEAIVAEIGATALRTADLMARLKTTFSPRTIGRALKVLKDEGIVSPSKSGRSTFWCLDTTSAKEVADVWQ